MNSILQNLSITSLLLLFFIPFSGELSGQSAFNYQAVVRDAAGNPMLNKELTVYIVLREGNEQGAIRYEEEHQTTTNNFGLINLQVGRGISLVGKIDEVDWGTNPVFMQIVIEDSETGIMQQLGVAELLSVPFAFYSKKSGNSTQGLWLENDFDIFFNEGNVGIGTEEPVALLHTEGLGVGRGNIVHIGSYTTDVSFAPIEGSGTRMMWYPDKASFRVGRVNGNQWDSENIGSSSMAWGRNNTASNFESTAWGRSTESSGSFSTSWGINSKATASGSTALGSFTEASGSNSIAWGTSTEASRDQSTAWGASTEASGTNSTSWGNITEASGTNSTSWGNRSIAMNMNSTAWGNLTQATGATSTAWGLFSEATGLTSTSWGNNTMASGNTSTAWGYESSASGQYSTAWGNTAEASATASTAWGSSTIASRGQSTAWGINTESAGTGATTWGRQTFASGHYSTAFGRHNQALSYCETAIGLYNTIYTPMSSNSFNSIDRLFVVGNGTSETNRSDALVILKDGSMGIATSDPQSGLHLLHSNNSSIDGFRIENSNSNDYTRLHVSSSNGNLRLYSNNGLIGDFDNSSGVYTPTSDHRLKTDFEDLYFDWESFMKLQPLSYRYKADAADNKRIGMVAQEVEKIYPEVINYLEDEDTYLMDYSAFGVIAIKAIQEQQQQIEALKAENQELKERAASSEAQTVELLQEMQREIQELRAFMQRTESEKMSGLE